MSLGPLPQIARALVKDSRVQVSSGGSSGPPPEPADPELPLVAPPVVAVEPPDPASPPLPPDPPEDEVAKPPVPEPASVPPLPPEDEAAKLLEDAASPPPDVTPVEPGVAASPDSEVDLEESEQATRDRKSTRL